NIERGDIITFRLNYIGAENKSGKEELIKRVVALPGDLLELGENGIFINGELSEAPEDMPDKSIIYENMEIIVPEGYYFVMGDNRDSSMDSRAFGAIPAKSVSGKILFRWFPFKEARLF
ncbi:MAG: signal peptidase I, partial [Firmicutes bacterium]|nr:signal peptidase I [Bacillota bacterium]